jgi:hypothetical protein
MFRFQFNKLFRGFAGLLESSNATVNISNPAFDDNFIFRQFATGIALPEVGNAVRGQLGNHPNSLSKVSEGALLIGGLPLDKGIVKIKSRGTESMGVTFQNNSIQFLEKLKKIKINEIMPTIDLMGGFEGIRFEVDYDYNSVLNYSIEIKGITFTLTQSLYAPSVPTQAYMLGSLINSTFPDFATIDPNSNIIQFNNYKAYPTLEINNSNYSATLTLLSWQTMGVWTEEKFRAIANNSVQNGDRRFAFPTIYNPGFYSNKNGNYGNFINRPKMAVTYTYYEVNLRKDYVRSPLIPFIKVGYVLEQIAIAAGIANIYNFDINEFNDILIHNNTSIAKLYTEYLQEPFLTGTSLGIKESIPGYPDIIDLNQFMPDMTADDFLKALCSFDLKQEIEDENIVLRSKAANYKRSVLDLTRYSVREYSIDEGSKNGFIVRYNSEKTEKQSQAGFGLDAKTSGEQEYIKDLLWNTFPMGTKYLEFDISIRVPLSDQAGNCGIYNVTNKQSTLRLLCYRGGWVVPTGSVNGLGVVIPGYPYASSDNRDPTDTYDSHELDLRITSANGIYNRFYKYLMPYLISARTMKKTANMPVGLFFKMLHDGHFNVFFRHPKGDVSGVVKEMSVKADNKSFGYVDVTMDVLLQQD